MTIEHYIDLYLVKYKPLVSNSSISAKGNVLSILYGHNNGDYKTAIWYFESRNLLVWNLLLLLYRKALDDHVDIQSLSINHNYR